MEAYNRENFFKAVVPTTFALYAHHTLVVISNLAPLRLLFISEDVKLKLAQTGCEQTTLVKSFLLLCSKLSFAKLYIPQANSKRDHSVVTKKSLLGT